MSLGVLENLMRLSLVILILVQFGQIGVIGQSAALLVGEVFRLEPGNVFCQEKEYLAVPETSTSPESATQMFVQFGQIGPTGQSVPQHVVEDPDSKSVNVFFLMCEMCSNVLALIRSVRNVMRTPAHLSQSGVTGLNVLGPVVAAQDPRGGNVSIQETL